MYIAGGGINIKKKFLLPDLRLFFNGVEPKDFVSQFLLAGAFLSISFFESMLYLFKYMRQSLILTGPIASLSSCNSDCSSLGVSRDT